MEKSLRDFAESSLKVFGRIRGSISRSDPVREGFGVVTEVQIYGDPRNLPVRRVVWFGSNL